MAKDSTYLHGTSADEQGRLSRMNQLLNEAAVRELRLRRWALRPDAAFWYATFWAEGTRR